MFDSVLKKLTGRFVRAWESPPKNWARLMQMTTLEREYLANIIKGKHFLELGSGYSTLWFSQYATRIVSVETREKWYSRLKKLVAKCRIRNVDLVLLPPEPCAYDAQGNEKWKSRAGRSDYGTVDEFTGYLHGIESLLENNTFDVVLVDGNIRHPIVEVLFNKHQSAIIFLHDVMPERDYLNNPIFGMNGVKVVRQIDTLVELSRVRDDDTSTALADAKSNPG